MASPRRRPYRPESQLRVESLEGRLVLSASIDFSAGDRMIRIIGTEGNDAATIQQQGQSLIVTVTSPSGDVSRTLPLRAVQTIRFEGLGGDDTYANNSDRPSSAFGGPGNDSLTGGLRMDRLLGGGDDDTLYGRGGNDVLRGEDGDDNLYGDAGQDWLFGGSGDDLIEGGAGPDRGHGDEGNDDMHGGEGADFLRGGLNNDTVIGDAGNDTLWGEEGDDRLDGRAGSDRIRGGLGLDYEDDFDNGFEDGDRDRDGYDDDHDRPVDPGLVMPVSFSESGTAQLTGTSAGEHDRDFYAFTATASGTLTVTLQPDATGRYPEVEVRNATTGRELLDLEPRENGRATGQVAVVAGNSYLIRVHSDSRLPLDYTIDLALTEGGPVAPPVVGGAIVFDPSGAAQISGTSQNDDDTIFFSFTATASGTLTVELLPGGDGRYAELELKDLTTRRELLELDPRERPWQTRGSVPVVAGRTYVFEIESPSDWRSVDFTVNLQLS